MKCAETVDNVHRQTDTDQLNHHSQRGDAISTLRASIRLSFYSLLAAEAVELERTTETFAPSSDIYTVTYIMNITNIQHTLQTYNYTTLV